MYEFSRAIYRELAGDLITQPRSSASRRAFLEACEATLQRLACDRHRFAKPARSLFREVRGDFPLASQQRVYSVIAEQIALATEFVDRAFAEGRTPEGSLIECHGVTRSGNGCRRLVVPGLQYCPSHRHLDSSILEASA